jgi:hypothetical protein
VKTPSEMHAILSAQIRLALAFQVRCSEFAYERTYRVKRRGFRRQEKLKPRLTQI